jgi:hypothetical protein
MRTRRPARLTLMILNGFLAGNDPLTGDLLEEFDTGRSQWWLLRQATAAALYEITPTSATMRGDMNTIMLGAGLLAVLSLEVVMVTNVLRRFMLGPPAPTMIGSIGNSALALTLGLAIVVSMALGFLLARGHAGHRQRSVALFTTGVFVSAALNISFTLGIQVVITAVFIAGLIVGGRLFGLSNSDATERHSIV